MRDLRGTIRRHMALHNLQYLGLIPGDQFAEPIDVTTQDSVDTFGVIGHEYLHPCKADLIPAVAWTSASYPIRPQDHR